MIRLLKGELALRVWSSEKDLLITKWGMFSWNALAYSAVIGWNPAYEFLCVSARESGNAAYFEQEAREE